MVAVIGDVHGCFQTLKQLVKKIKTDYPETPIYCVGDLVDRGNNSCDVIEFVRSENIHCVIGNHDFMFYSNMRDPFSIMAKSWNYNGAETTLASYKDRIDMMDEHLDFIISQPLYYNLNDCFISHAGISNNFEPFFKNGIPSDKELNEILKKDLADRNSILWTRDSLLNIGKLQVIGHTHKKDIYHDTKSNALYVDTTAYGNNKLTAVIIENNKCVKVIKEKSVIADVNKNWIYQL